MPKIIFDIETAGEDFENIDKKTQEMMTWWIKRESKNDKEYQANLQNLREELGFSPLTGEIVSIGMLDYDTKKGAVYFQAPEKDVNEFEEDGIKYKPMDEKDIIKNFWSIAEHASEFISFNGRAFDVPFILVRGAIHKIKPPKDLMSNRYLGSQKYGAKHIDLLDQLTFYGSVRKKGSLHMWTRVFKIKSPKEDGVDGSEIAGLFKEKEYAKIAKYNARDLFATRDLFEYWNNYLRF
ncbi:MAG: ribonuclease H-like domain-containing protein [Patescibacteria group bacterium]|nr:ribonuclease H-like domain-containing protein [Patescibacteria group bacterium]